MKIYSANSEATVTLTTSIGLVATVGHFYRGEPVHIEHRIKVLKLRISERYDYFIGLSNLKAPSKIAVVDLNVGDEVVIKTDRGSYRVRITEVMPLGSKYFRYKFEPSIVDEGDSGSPVYYDNVIVGYVTHTNVFNSIAPMLDGLLEAAKKLGSTKS